MNAMHWEYEAGADEAMVKLLHDAFVEKLEEHQMQARVRDALEACLMLLVRLLAPLPQETRFTYYRDCEALVERYRDKNPAVKFVLSEPMGRC